MRKNTPRKWIHAILDLLPLLVIPILAIYSQRHDINSNIVERIEPNYITLEQNVLNGFPTSDLNNISSSFTEYPVEYSSTYQYVYVTSEPVEEMNGMTFDSSLTVHNGDKLFFTSWFSMTDSISEIECTIGDNINFNVSYLRGSYYFEIFASTSEFECEYLNFTFYAPTDEMLAMKEVQLFNLTTIFGSGNEPTANDFNTWLNKRYIDFGTHSLQYGTHSVIYNDTDIGSQFIYQMYNVTDKYFNFNRLFNMGDIYSWLNHNLFGSNAPLPVTIVWNIIVYEFFIDLIFLIYSFFMFVIDWSTNMIDKFLYNARK